MCDCEKTPDVPYIVHEAALAREERTIKRLWILCIIMFLALVVSNAGWIWYEDQWEEVVTTETTTTQNVDQDAESGSNTFVGGDYYGETNNKDNDQNENDQNPETEDRR